MGRKCLVCGRKISFWASVYSLSNKHTGIYVCDPCDDLLRLARKGDKESLEMLNSKVFSDATSDVKEYIESLSNIKAQQIDKPSSDTATTDDELIGVARKNAISKIKYSEDEKLIKTYCCSIMSYPYGRGYLLVTNKRLIYSGLSKKSCFMNETSIDTVSGINTMYGKRVSLTKLLFGILLAILGIIFIFYDKQFLNNVIIAIFNVNSFVLFATSLIIIITSIKKCFKLAIYSTKATGTPINVTTGKGDFHNVMFSLCAMPTKETDKMIFELGALIHDIQTMADNAIDKWRD